MSDRVESCKEFVRRIVRFLIEWRAENCKVFVGRIVRCLNELELKEFVGRIVRCLNEWRAVRSLSRELSSGEL